MKRKTAVFYMLLNIFITRPSFKNLSGVFFDKGSIDVKSVLTFEKWPLMAELKLKM